MLKHILNLLFLVFKHIHTSFPSIKRELFYVFTPFSVNPLGLKNFKDKR
jgi:hypothetical protein